MYPLLFTIGTWHLYSGFAFYNLGVVAGITVGLHEAFRLPSLANFPKWKLVLVIIGGAILAYWAGRLNGGLFNLESAIQHNDPGQITHSGFVSFGAILGTLLFGFVFSKAVKIASGPILDILALILPLIESIYRIGCLLMGCCFGRETSGFGGMYLPDVYGVWKVRYPTQLLLGAFCLLLFLWLLRKRRSGKTAPGQQTFHFLFIYCAGRFLIDFLRAGLPTFGFLNYQQIAELVIFCGTLIIFLKMRGLSHLVR
jgi:phosphatidylglycerol---prolipoprotein diacylglyceryl transferase